MAPTTPLSVAILGASGYTGVELLRLLLGHPQVRVKVLTGERQAGNDIRALFPALSGFDLPILCKIEDVDFSAVDVVFCCLPHATSQQVIAGLPASCVVIDLSADFRLKDIAVYEQWYGVHQAPALQPQAVYGLTEHARDAVRTARLIANPGCYPTSSLLPLMPLLVKKLIRPEGIIIDAKSGVSGAGRSLKESSLAAEVQEGFQAYGIGKHRHLPEIEQGCSLALGAPVRLTFTPHLLPINRGILSTIYVQGAAEQVHQALVGQYAHEPFVQVLPFGQTPSTRNVRGSNVCQIGVSPGCVPDQVIITSAIDNLVKGASGQAVQNMNVRFGFDETLALPRIGMFP